MKKNRKRGEKKKIRAYRENMDSERVKRDKTEIDNR